MPTKKRPSTASAAHEHERVVRSPSSAAVGQCRGRRVRSPSAQPQADFSHCFPKLTDRAGMMVSPKAAEAAATSRDQAGLAGPQARRGVGKDRIRGASSSRLLNKEHVSSTRHYLPIVDSTVRRGKIGAGGLDMMERVLATDIQDVWRRDFPS